jgi:uncharacterized damage-inducible protein DinB
MSLQNFQYQSSVLPLQQLAVLLSQLHSEAYRQSLPILSDSSIGMHVRHIVEFYTCLLKGVAIGSVNYDARPRELILESDREYAVTYIQNLCEELNMLSGNPDLFLQVSLDTSEPITEIKTNLHRELTYVVEHAIHHMAIIKMACRQHFPLVPIHPHFGIAYSTIKYTQPCAL